MKDEILAAVLFLVRFIEKTDKFPRDKLETFKKQLIDLLTQRFQDHWFPECPAKGQGYRCIRVNELNPIDVTLEKAARQSGLLYADLRLPIELTLWVDPNEVCCRFGESEGSYCTLASFSDKGNHLVVTEQMDRVLTASPQSDDSGNISDSSFESIGGSSGTGSPPKSSMFLSDADAKKQSNQRKNRYSRGSFSTNFLNKQAVHSNANQRSGQRGVPVQRPPWRNNWYSMLPPYAANSGMTAPLNSYGSYRQTSYGRAATGTHTQNVLTV